MRIQFGEPAVGRWIFLLSSSVLFIALISTCSVLRVMHPDLGVAGFDVLPAGQAVASTLVVLASIGSLAAGMRWRARGDARAGGAVVAALILGWLFLVLQGDIVRTVWLASERTALLGAQIRGMVLLLGIMHLAQVLMGLMALAVTAPPVLVRQPAPAEMERFKDAAKFWSLMDVAWIELLWVLFLI